MRHTIIGAVAVTYDALGRMVEQTSAGVSTEMEYSPTGFVMALLKGQSEVKLFMPFPGGTEQVWQTGGGASPYYRHSDWLGGSRFASTQSRTMYNDLAYAPFGETYAQAGSTGVTNISFAGNDENTVANLYDAQFREYGIQGRWPSPYPAGIAAANPANPQSWNRYAYVLNNPVLFFDPLGLDPDGTPCSVSDKGHADPGNSTSCVCDISGSGCIWQTTTVVVSGNPPPPIPTISGPPAGPPAESVDNNPQAFGSGPGNPPPQTKQQCVNDALQSKFGSFVANKVIPEFSLYSLAGGAASIWNFVKGSGIALGAKAAAGGPWAYGKILSVTGKNLAQYPGLSVAAADATEAGAFWTSIGAATLETAGTAALALTAFATGAEAWARGQCKNVP